MKRLLFVDDDVNLLHSYKRLFFQMRSQWDILLISDPYEARKMILKETFDVIICDLLMPGIKGDKLLYEAWGLSSDTYTILLSGEEQLPEEKPPWVDRYFNKPCHFEQIKEVLESLQ